MDIGLESRLCAIRIIFRWMRTGAFPDRMIGEAPAEVRGFVMQLVYGAVRWARMLDEVLAERVPRPPTDDAQAAMMIGAFQLLRLKDMPAYAAIDSTVEALKVFGGRRAPAGFVNAVLRGIDRSRGEIEKRLAEKGLGVRQSHPDDLIERWTARWGAEKAEAICAWDNEPAEITMVTLPHGPSVETLMMRFQNEQIEAAPHPAAPEEAIRLGHGIRVESLPGFSTGDFTVQDPATLEAVRLMDVQPGMRVLDACASPGGKAARMARAMNGQGELVAMERHEDRMPLLRDTLRRLVAGAPVHAFCGDATFVTPRDLGGTFDAILIDAPCSNTGVLRRRPDARWRFSPERLKKLNELQVSLLDNAVRLLAPGGAIVYSTCSIEEAENEAQVDAFLKRHPDFRLAGSKFRLPPECESDGAFAARLERAR